jgi:hypothetical protein
MNIFAFPIDNQTAIIRSNGLKKTSLIRLGFLCALVLALMVYTLVKSNSLYDVMTGWIIRFWGVR